MSDSPAQCIHASPPTAPGHDWEILVAHAHSPAQDAALELLKQSVTWNTPAGDLARGCVVTDARPDVCPYAKWNEMCARSRARVVVFVNNDMVLQPGWFSLVRAVTPGRVATGYLVEAGVVDVHPLNIARNFGTDAASYQREACERYCALVSIHTPDSIPNRSGWFMPCAFDREWFLSTGGYDTGAGRFPQPLDRLLWDKLGRVPGVLFMRVNSWAYHFQRLSQRPEPKAEEKKP